MGITKRIYYIGEGETFEGSEDGGKTWGEYTRCKTIDFNGSTLVWAPPGYKAVRKKLSTKHPYLKHVVSGKPMLEKNRSIYVAVEGGPEDSFLDLEAGELRMALREANRDGLVMEDEYRERLSADALRKRAERLLAEAAAKEGEAEPKPAKKTASRKTPRASA